MPTGTVLSGRARVVFFIACLTWGAGIHNCFGAALPEPAVNSAVPVSLSLVSHAPELSYLQRLSPPPFNPSTQLGLRYFHPWVQILHYGSDFIGPQGHILLPGNREWNAEMLFAIRIGDEERQLSPKTPQVHLTVQLGSGYVREEWLWTDGVSLSRTYFQSPYQPGIGIRYTLHNRSSKMLRGLRFEARIQDPEIVEKYLKNRPTAEEDDQVIADPRAAVLFQRDFMAREESWLALGWSPRGGLLTAGESQESEFVFAQQQGQPIPELAVSLETPAQDLAPGESTRAVFWIVWGLDRNAVSNRLEQLRKYTGYREWEEKVKTVSTQGMKFSCQDPYLTFLFQMVKAWNPWLISKGNLGIELMSSTSDNHPPTSKDLATGLKGALMFGHDHAIKRYLDHALDQRTETTESAFTAIAACKYYLLSRDEIWLKENSLRIQELFKFIEELDHDQDGLPDFEREANQNFELENAFAQSEKTFGQEVQFFRPVLASVLAFHYGAELFNSMTVGSPTALHYQELARQAETSLLKKYWEPNLGKKGFFSLGRLKEQNLVVQHPSLDAIDAVLERIGSEEQQRAVFLELWTNPAWRTPEQRYLALPSDAPDHKAHRAFEDEAFKYSRTHDILLAGLIQPQSATEAVDRLVHYAEKVVLDPRQMGFISSMHPQKASGLNLSSLNFMDVILYGLCGLEFSYEGLKIHIPTYTQDLNIDLKGLKMQTARINVRVKSAAKGKILINGKPIKSGDLIPQSSLKNKNLDIIIEKSLPLAVATPARKPSSKYKKYNKKRKD